MSLTSFLGHANNASSTISTVGGISSSSTSVSIQVGDVSAFPSSGNFEVTLWPNGTNPTLANCEIILVTAGQGTQTFTISRGQEGTTAKSFNQGDNIALLLTKKNLTDIEGLLSGQSQGAVPYFNSNGILVPLAPGISGQVLQSQGSNANPQWSTVNTGAWTADTNTWTYASANTFTIAGNVTSIYTPGTRVQCINNSATFYGVVQSSSYSSPNTTITLVANTDYSLANSAITDPQYSYAASPPGYPTWFNFTPTLTWTAGTAPSGSPTLNGKFSVIGNQCTFFANGHGYTAGSTVTKLTVSVPVNSNLTGWITGSGIVSTSGLFNATFVSGNFDNASVISMQCTSISATMWFVNITYPF
jgi:hypothetical protein